MIKKYIKSNKERGSEVIKELEKLGGINEYKLTGDIKDSIFFINSKNFIARVRTDTEFSKTIMECFEEIELPEKVKKIEAIKGDPIRGAEVIKLLESMGGKNVSNFEGKAENCYYFINNKGNIEMLFCNNGNEEEFDIIKLPEKKPVLKVVHGNIKRGGEVIKFLENLGGVNKSCCSGKNEAFYYYINHEGCIEFHWYDDSFFDDYELEVLELPEKKPILKVIKGDPARCEEVMKLLGDMGGVNKMGCIGDSNKSYYYINSNGNIVLRKCGESFFNDYELEVLTLPEKKPLLKVIKGDKKRGDEIIKLLESMGGENESSYKGRNCTCYYFIDEEGCIDYYLVEDEFFNQFELEVLELPEKQEYPFRPFDRVLVRDYNDHQWIGALFSNIDNDKTCKFVCSGSHWKYCIPYKGNEHLLGTTDNPKE